MQRTYTSIRKKPGRQPQKFPYYSVMEQMYESNKSDIVTTQMRADLISSMERYEMEVLVEKDDVGLVLEDLRRDEDETVRAVRKTARVDDVGPLSRVANERINTLLPLDHGAIAFIRMRSPSRAPPDLRREGSMEMRAMRCWSFWQGKPYSRATTAPEYKYLTNI